MIQVFGLFLIAVSLNAAKPEGLIRIPLLFEENRGQARDGAFLVHSGNAEIRFGKAVTYRAANAQYSVAFAGANNEAPLHAEQPHPAKVNYYRGSLRAEAVPAYEALRYRGLYPGIDLLYHGRTGELEYDFQVASFADPRRIQLHFSGAQSISLSPEGDLIVKAANETMRHKRPIAWQDIDGRRTLVPAWFRLDGDTVRFALAPYNRRHPLTIDPILKFATVLSTAVTALASDSAGNTFLAGSPTVSAADTDAVVLKLDPTGKLIYRTVIGGFGTDTTSGIAVDAQGNLFVTGHSESPNFPISGAPCSALQSDAFLSKLSTTGILLASRCYGGLGVERTVGIGLDNAGAPYIAGTTTSQDLPTTSPTVQGQKLVPTSNSGFLAKFDPSNLALVYGTYLGNHATITVNSLAIDPTGAAIVAGTSSPQGFRVTPGAYNTTAPSSSVVLAPFVLKVNPAGTALVYSTWLPATTGVSSSAVAAGVDESGQAIVAYPADFPWSSFPLKIVKLNSQGTGAVLERPFHYFQQPGPMHVDRLGNVLVGGQSPDPNSAIPTNDSLQGRPAVHLVLKFSPDLSTVQHLGLVNGQVTALASGPSNDILVAYSTTFSLGSAASPVTPGAYSENSQSSPFAVYRLTQGSTCTPSLAPSTIFTLPTTGGSGNLQVVAPDNCTWVATASDRFGLQFQFTGTRTGTGNGSIPFTFPQLFGPETGRVFTVRLSATVSYEFTQGQPPSCQALLGSISPISVQPGGGRTSFSISLLEGCPWTVTSNAPWATLSTPASGKGSATVALDVQPNTGAARTTTISINDQNVILNQSACDYTVSQTWNSLAQTTFLNVSTASGCSWTISSNAAWLQIGIPATTLMSGPASVPVTVEQNTTAALRSATVTVGGRTFSLTQTSSDCSLTASSANPLFPSGGGNGTIEVNANTCTAFLNLNSIGQSSSAPVTGQGQFNFTVPANTSTIPRGFLAQVGSSLLTLTIPFLQEGVNTPQPFTDVAPGSTFFNHIAILKDRNVTRGCTFDGQQYCPSNTVTRADMALFLARAMNLQTPSPNIPYFDDVPPTHPAFLAIQAIRAVGITLGCSSVPALYCPDQPLSRAQMAALIIRAKQGSDNFSYVSTPYFTDVSNTHIFFRHIQYLRDIGVTLGCTTTTFCPDSPNTRGEMSAFIVRAFLSGQ